MTILDIITYPTPSLSRPSETVDRIDDDIKTLVTDMGETMFNAPGVGLAAPQVAVNKRIIVYDAQAADPEADPEKKEFDALINPEIIAASGSLVSENEGCLSVEDYTANVKRFEHVTVRAMDIKGNPVEFTASGIKAIIMQHEIDHLNGILFIDRISALKRAMYKKKITRKKGQSA